MKLLSLVTSSILVLTQAGCSGLFYYPDSKMYYRPEKLPIVPVQVELHDRQNRKLIGWYFKTKNQGKPKAKILFFHGNAQNISSHFAGLYWILDHGYDFFIFDYPGYGGSEGEPDRDSVVEAGYTALKWIHEQEDPQIPIAVLGQSLGGNIALYTVSRYQKEFPVCQVLVDSSFLSYPHVAQTVLSGNLWTWPLQWVPYLVVSNYKSAKENLDGLPPTPLIVMHGDADQTVRFENGEMIFAKALEPKTFWRVPSGDHIDGFTGKSKDEFRKKYLESLAKDCGSK